MTETQAQEYAISTYTQNIEYFKNNHKELFNNLSLFDIAIETKQIEPTYDLQFVNGSFDLVHIKTNQFYYNRNSVQITNSMVEEQANFIPYEPSFKAFYDQNFPDEVAKRTLQAPINEPNAVGNAPIINYVNKNTPHDARLNEIFKYMIFGVGLGMHIPLIHEKIKAKIYLIVEPSLEIFKLSLFVTNYALLAKEAKLMFCVAKNEFDFRKDFDVFYGESFIDNHYFKFFKLSNNCDIYLRTVQNFLVAQGHYLYTYDRTFLSIFRTNKYITNNYRILDISKVHSLNFSKKPILLLAAGPSLQRNIEFVKANKDRFTIVAIYATLPLLETHNIKPDFITQYDEQNHQVINTLEKIKDINFFKDSILLIASHVNEKLTQSFPKENVYIFQAMFELKKGFGTLTSPSIGELTYALTLKLGAKEIYLLGLDLALDVETNQTHIDGHSGADAFKSLKNEEESTDQSYSYRKNTISVKGNFLDTVKTIPVFKSNIDTFNYMTVEFKSNDVNVYNLSNGAYFNNTIPLKIENINLEILFELKDFKTSTTYKKELDLISEASYNQEDLELINLKISTAKKYKKILEKFYKIKSFSSYDEYKTIIFQTLNQLLFESTVAKDLQSILTNYCQHNLHYVFYLFNTNEVKNYKKHIKNINNLLYTQLNKIINTYVVCISYSLNDNSAIIKKLNKYLKEHSIQNTIYNDLFFQELVESSKNIEHQTYKKNCVGFFATNENLSNKNFIEYIKNLYKRFPHLNFKIFYFFEFQKFQCDYQLKNEKDRIELILPKKINDIVENVELWIESYNLSYNIKKVSDIILNNYKNIYSIFFKDELYKLEIENFKEKETKIDTNLQLKEQLSQNYILPNTPYYKFCDSLKQQIDEEKLNETYKKEHIGFFAFEENLTQEFLKNIHEIYQTFPQLKFVLFYFEEEQKQNCEKVFAQILDRIEFVMPKDIYDIAWNIELWVQAEIKNQSYLFIKTYKILDEFTQNIFSVIVEENFEAINSKDFKISLIKKLEEKYLKKELKQNFTPSILQKYTKNCLGLFLSNNFSLKSIIISNKDIILKIFYFDTIDKELLNHIFKNKKVEIIKFTSVSNIIDNVEIWLTDLSKDTDQTLLKLHIFLSNNCPNIYTHTFNKDYSKDINYYINLAKKHIVFDEYKNYNIPYSQIQESQLNILKIYDYIGIIDYKDIKEDMTIKDLNLLFIKYALNKINFKGTLFSFKKITNKLKETK
jgi:hypothetical protein